jgi:lipid A 3-O-deacylase
LALALTASVSAQAADLPSPAIPLTAEPLPLFDPTKFEIRGGFLVAPFGTEEGTSDATGVVVFPKFVRLPGWDDLLVPRLRIGGVANLGGGTSYGYLDALWTVNFNRMFVEGFFGGLVHDGPLVNHLSDTASALGCRELYHFGADLGYRFDQHWSVMVTFEHGSNGAPTWSGCSQNRGLNVAGVSVGYSF